MKLSILVAVLGASVSLGAELHVAVTGSDTQDGSGARPLRTIGAAAERAQPGDIITVHAGTYRERVAPPRGGTSPERRIIYRAAEGEQVQIKGSEVITNWEKVRDDVWKVTVPNTFFGAFNPYSDLIHGDWFDPRGRAHHTGAVYLNGEWLVEAVSLEAVLNSTGNPPLWFGRVTPGETTIWARFPAVNPNGQLVEINVRRTVFYPEKPGINYITVRGFTLRQAATPWAPPTAEQPGLIGTHWSKGWIIEGNTISHSICSGISLGKYGDEWDNTSANTAEGYVKTIERALRHGWNREDIGHHIVRSNTISHCEQAGIVGSLGAAFSTVTGNVIHDIHVRALFSGAEMAGIKFHGAIDTLIEGNHIYRTCRGLWLDWMAQGTRVSRNFFHENAAEDLFVEVNHGPFVVDNNLFVSAVSLLDMSEGGAYAHNLFCGKIISRAEPNRETPFHPAHSTEVAGLSKIRGGDNRYFNNIFVGNAGENSIQPNSAEFGLCAYDARELPLRTGGNVYCNGARPWINEKSARVLSGRFTRPAASLRGDEWVLSYPFPLNLEQNGTRLVTGALLGKAAVSGMPYEDSAGCPLTVDLDFLGRRRDSTHPRSGPFENWPAEGVTVWPPGKLPANQGN